MTKNFDEKNKYEKILERRRMLKQEYRACYDCLCNLIFHVDPVEINLDDNIDEYEPETDDILTSLSIVKTEEEIYELLFKVFDYFFYHPKSPLEKDSITDKRLKKLARRIYEHILPCIHTKKESCEKMIIPYNKLNENVLTRSKLYDAVYAKAKELHLNVSLISILKRIDEADKVIIEVEVHCEEEQQPRIFKVIAKEAAENIDESSVCMFVR